MTPTSCYTYVSAIIGTETYSLSDDRISIEEDDGLGAPPNHDIPERGPLQHGETRVDFRLDPRIITHIFNISGRTEGELYNARKRLLDIYRARNPSNPIQHRYELSNGDVRQIDCFYLSDMTFPSADRRSFYSSVRDRGFYQRVAVRLKCYDPVFYDPTRQLLQFDVGEDATIGMLVPTPVPTHIGRSVIDQTTTLNYTGTWREYPVIRIYGPVRNVVIENQTTGETLALKSGVTIDVGDYYEIDLRYGFKTVKNAAGVNKIADLTDDSDLATFHIQERDPGFTTGANIFQVSGENLNTQTAIQIYYYLRYIGL